LRIQNEDYAITRRLFYSKDIHWFRYSQKKAGQFQTDLFFHKTYSMPSNAEDLYQYVERTFPDHAVDLVYEAGCCGSPRHDILNGWNVLVVNPSDVERR
jgi:hypothetical protein